MFSGETSRAPVRPGAGWLPHRGARPRLHFARTLLHRAAPRWAWHTCHGAQPRQLHLPRYTLAAYWRYTTHTRTPLIFFPLWYWDPRPMALTMCLPCTCVHSRSLPCLWRCFSQLCVKSHWRINTVFSFQECRGRWTLSEKGLSQYSPSPTLRCSTPRNWRPYSAEHPPVCIYHQLLFL